MRRAAAKRFHRALQPRYERGEPDELVSAVHSATTTGAWSVTPLTGSIGPGGYYLVQQAAGAKRARRRCPPRMRQAPSRWVQRRARLRSSPPRRRSPGRARLEGSSTSSVMAAPTVSRVVRRRPPATRRRPCASVAAVSIPTITDVDFSIRARRRGTRRYRPGAARRCRAHSRHPGQRAVVATARSVRHHDRHRHRREDQRLLPAVARGDDDTDPATSEALFVFTSVTPGGDGW